MTFSTRSDANGLEWVMWFQTFFALQVMLVFLSVFAGGSMPPDASHVCSIVFERFGDDWKSPKHHTDSYEAI